MTEDTMSSTETVKEDQPNKSSASYEVQTEKREECAVDALMQPCVIEDELTQQVKNPFIRDCALDDALAEKCDWQNDDLDQESSTDIVAQSQEPIKNLETVNLFTNELSKGKELSPLKCPVKNKEQGSSSTKNPTEIEKVTASPSEKPVENKEVISSPIKSTIKDNEVTASSARDPVNDKKVTTSTKSSVKDKEVTASSVTSSVNVKEVIVSSVENPISDKEVTDSSAKGSVNDKKVTTSSVKDPVKDKKVTATPVKVAVKDKEVTTSSTKDADRDKEVIAFSTKKPLENKDVLASSIEEPTACPTQKPIEDKEAINSPAKRPKEVPPLLQQLSLDFTSNRETKTTKNATPLVKVTRASLSLLNAVKWDQNSVSKKMCETSGENKQQKITRSSKRYIYKLKSAKSGKILKYTSNIPIVLKIPVISLTKIKDPVASERSIVANEIGIDKDNAPNIAHTAKKRGRPNLRRTTTPLCTKVKERNDLPSGPHIKEETSTTFGMQTRKKKLKFLPDGRVVNPNEPVEDEDKISDMSSDDRDNVKTGSDDEDYVQSEDEEKKSNVDAKKSTSVEKRAPRTTSTSVFAAKGGKMRKLDLEKCKPGSTPLAEAVGHQRVEMLKNKLNASLNTSSVTTRKVTQVDPAQLLSSLIGVHITPSQLNIVKFKPKVIQERNNSIVPKRVTLEPDKKLTLNLHNDVTKSSTGKMAPTKPGLQKILPKPTSGECLTSSVVTKVVEHKAVPGFTPIISKIKENVTNDMYTKFNHFTDTKIVKTKEGPKKALKRKASEMENDQPKTIYDLMCQVFDEMPSWNLHVIPDTRSFCIAQVARGRMGIPILKKSIEINEDFAAKVYVHQLHCKRFDGVYDSENKILSLIKEIDSLAA